ncbi:MAG: TrkA family potassium uptake protein [Clostridiales bacterium]|nr:TrkA family potassium uptake protein [Clostridiales bacterium]
MKSILVIGMGRLGKHFATKMLELGNDVMIVDKDDRTIEQYSSMFTDSQIGDCRNESVLRAIGVNNFDICFVAIGEDFQASLEITSMLKELGASYIISKAREDRQAKFLRLVGANEVVYPEREVAEKLAMRYNAGNIFDFIKLTSEYSIYEIQVVPSWIGKSIFSLDIRRKYSVNIIGIKHGNQLKPLPSPDYVFSPEDHLVVIGKSKDVFALTQKK